MILPIEMQNKTTKPCSVLMPIRNKLGEGLFVTTNCIYWLDILSSMLFIMDSSNKEIISYKLPEQASDIWKVDLERYVYLATESGVATFDIKAGSWILNAKLPSAEITSAMRANDGGVLTSEIYCFGTMAKSPVKDKGALYIFNGKKITKVYDGISIPNSFIKLNDTQMLITDSLEQVVYKFTFAKDYSKIVEREIWVDHSADNITPDGGCIDKLNNIYMAIWDGFCIQKYDKHGMFLAKIPLNVPRATNCKLNANEDILYVTTATEGLTKKELQLYPDSGGVLEIKLTK